MHVNLRMFLKVMMNEFDESSKEALKKEVI